MKFMVETSARHVHLSQEHLDILFGKDYALTKKKDLSQPGQFACEERVTVVEKEHVTRTKYRRVGRHRRIADGVRHTYYLRVRFADGLEKRYSVSQAEYGRTREHAEKTLVLRRGLLGVPVIRR